MFLRIIRCLSDTGRRSLIWVCSLLCPTLRVFHLYSFPAGFPGCCSVFWTAGWWQTCGASLGEIRWTPGHQLGTTSHGSFTPLTPVRLLVAERCRRPGCIRVGEQTQGWGFRFVGLFSKVWLTDWTTLNKKNRNLLKYNFAERPWRTRILQVNVLTPYCCRTQTQWMASTLPSVIFKFCVLWLYETDLNSIWCTSLRERTHLVPLDKLKIHHSTLPRNPTFAASSHQSVLFCFFLVSF